MNSLAPLNKRDHEMISAEPKMTIYVDDHAGVDNRGRKDSSVALRALLLQHPKARFLFGSGTYALLKPLSPSSHQKIQGQGMLSTVLKFMSSPREHAMIQVAGDLPAGEDPAKRRPVIGVSISDCTIDGVDEAGQCIQCIKTHFLLVERVLIQRSRGYGIGLQLADPPLDVDVHQYPKFIDCVVQRNRNDGIDVKAASKLLIRGCSFRGNGENGIDIRGDGVVSDTYSENNGMHPNGTGRAEAFGIRCRSTLPSHAPFDVRISNCSTKGNVAAGIRLDGTDGRRPSIATILGCRAMESEVLSFGEYKNNIVVSGAGNFPNELNR